MESAPLENILRGIRSVMKEHILPPRPKVMLDVAAQLLAGCVELPAKMNATVKRSMYSQTIDRVLALLDVADAITPHNTELRRALSMLLDACFRCSEKLQKEENENVPK